MWRKRRPLPPAPVNVRLQDAEGHVYPLELAYIGRRRGLDRWRATTTVTLDWHQPFELRADELPGATAIELEVRREPDDGSRNPA
jgi:hypothetical protein